MTKVRDLHINVKIRIIENFLSRFIGSMILPFMAIYLTIHFNATIAGFLLLFNVIIGVSINFLSGYFSDYYGRRKIIVISETIRFISFVVMAICNSPLYTLPLLTYAMMLVNSFCTGLTLPANDAMLVDVSTEKQRKLIYSIMYWSGNLSVAIGGVLGAFLFEDYLFELFIILSFLSFLVVVIVFLFIRESYYPNNDSIPIKSHIKGILTNYRFVLNDKKFILFITASILIYSVEFQLSNYIAIRLSEVMPEQRIFGISIDGIQTLGILKSENTILVLILMLFVNKIAFKYNTRKTLVVSSLIFILGYSVMSYTVNFYILLIMMLIATIGEVIYGPLEQTYIANMTSEKHRSSYMAFNGLKGNLAMLIASITVALSAIFPPIIISIFIFILGIVGILIYRYLLSRIQ
mgnify:CR=1 FL=1